MSKSRLIVALIGSMISLLIGLLLLLSAVSAAPPQAENLIITGILDGPLPGGLPKLVELYALSNVPDLSVYGIGSATNGGGTDGEEFTFPADAVAAGQFIYVTTEITGMITYLGITSTQTTPIYEDSAVTVNGDDAIELFEMGVVIDTFGDINTDGSGESWEYLDGWAYRQAGSAADGATFALNNWYFSGINALDGTTVNSSFPVGSYDPAGTPLPITPVPTMTVSATDTPTPMPTMIATAAPGAAVVIISEFMANPDALSDTNGEWIELYNPNDTPFDLNGCELSDDGSNMHVISGTVSVPALGYAVLGVNGITNTAPLDYTYDGYTLANGDDEIYLVCEGVLIDAVAYDDSAGWEIPVGASAALSDLTADNNSASNWCESATTWSNRDDGDAGSPGQANDCVVVTPTPEATSTTAATPTITPTIIPISTPQPGDPLLVINEIMADPAELDDTVGEWMELYNPGSDPFDLNGCELRDSGSNSHVISGTLSVDAGGYAVLGRSIISTTAPVDYLFSSFTLSNGDDEIMLICNDLLIDHVAYDNAWPITAGASIQLNPDETGADNGVLTHWFASEFAWAGSSDFGTPGEINDAQPQSQEVDTPLAIMQTHPDASGSIGWARVAWAAVILIMLISTSAFLREKRLQN